MEEKRWLRWNGQYYENYSIGIRTELLQATVEVARATVASHMADTTDKEAQRFYRGLIRSFSTANFPRDLETLIHDLSLVSSEDFDRDSNIFSCSSGVLDREAAQQDGTIIWLPHDEARLTTRCISVEYDPEATCEEWLEFLRSSIEDGGKRLQVMLGFALAGDNTKKKRIVNLIGPRDTGKSTCLETIREIIGPYLGNMRTDEVIVSRNNSKFDFHGIRNARAVFLSEPDAHSRFRVGDLKRITGGETMTTEGKGQIPVDWRASVMPFIGTNEEIDFDVRDEAFKARLEYIYFQRTREIDYNLKRRLQEERAGIFNWILEGVIRYFNGELAETPESEAARQRAMSAVETPLQFIDIGLENGDVFEVPDDYPAYKCCQVGKLHTSYLHWYLREIGDKPIPYGRKRFSEVVQSRYPSPDKSASGGYRVFRGIAFHYDIGRAK